VTPSPTSFPPAGLASSTFPPEDINATHTHASYSKQPITELANNDHSNWTLTLNVPIPEDIIHPILGSLSYTVKYSTANGQTASALQTTVMLTSEDDDLPIPDGIAIDQPNPVLFQYGAGIGFAPQSHDVAATLCLSSVPATKPCEQPGQWNYYVDRQEISPGIRITTESCLALRFHVVEHPTATMIRSLLVDVSATWLEDLPGKRLLEKLQEAEKKAEEAEVRAAAAEEARKVAVRQRVAADKRSEEARIAKEAAEKNAKSLEQARLVAEANAVQQRVAREAAEANAQAEKQARSAAEHMLQLTAPSKADPKLQKNIAKALEKLPSNRHCENGYVWNRTPTGYRCDGGAHFVTFEELAAASH